VPLLVPLLRFSSIASRVPSPHRREREEENRIQGEKLLSEGESAYNLGDRGEMELERTEETTQLLQAWAQGSPEALERLMPRVYRELRRIAGRCMHDERPAHTIQATALVHEAYLKLIDVSNVDWQHRAHFYAVSARIMRRILLDRARRRTADKRGGNIRPVNLAEVPDVASMRARELIALDDALEVLAAMDERKARVIELRFFGGLSVEETAAVTGVSGDTVLRDWKLARAWLLVELGRA
jgi:RNA polymerase sigma-70 factor, ECF subfamily